MRNMLSSYRPSAAQRRMEEGARSGSCPGKGGSRETRRSGSGTYSGASDFGAAGELGKLGEASEIDGVATATCSGADSGQSGGA
mmetsp:Transcript_95168/g.212801  ORF Transcript_95168/g.212801 Transcript_95168/m.212801 type:complete len:84 (+) Transcript_95168:18-269(+)